MNRVKNCLASLLTTIGVTLGGLTGCVLTVVVVLISITLVLYIIFMGVLTFIWLGDLIFGEGAGLGFTIIAFLVLGGLGAAFTPMVSWIWGWFFLTGDRDNKNRRKRSLVNKAY